jgi:8-oxo-dGTP pyrophosphatase MutT (NUDIX family)
MFKLKSQSVVLKTHPFNVEEIQFEVGDLKPQHPYFRLNAPDWVNVLPVMADGRIILVRQPRVGSLSYVLETPGGVIDMGERDPTLAAARELEEETGFVSQRFLPLGSMNPNPAIMTNKCHFFLALGCLPAANRKSFPDVDERITLEFFEYNDLDALIRTGQINHALACLCISLAGRYIKSA